MKCRIDGMKKNFLLVDDEEGIREILSFFVEDMSAGKATIFYADSGNKANAILSSERIDVCICDHNMPDGMGPVVLQHIFEQKLATKYVLCSTVVPSDDPVNYPADKVYFNIQKPEIYQGMELLFQKLTAEIPQSSTSESNLNHNEFTPVTGDFLALLLFAPANVYIRLSETKVVKCFNKNDIFDQAEKEKYSSKGVHTFYLQNSGRKNEIMFAIKKRIREFLTGTDLMMTDRLALTHHQICEMIKLEGLTSEHQEMVKDTISQTAKIISTNQKLTALWERIEMVGDYPSQLYTLQIMIASLALKKLSWNSEATFMKIGIAAFLQDITLDDLTLIKIRDYAHFFQVKDTLSESDRKKFLDHPVAASQLVTKFSEIPPDVDRIVLEQHEMPNGNGFPKMLNATHTGPLSCLFILSGIVAREMLERKSNISRAEFIARFEAEGYNKGNYREIFEAIRDTLT